MLKQSLLQAAQLSGTMINRVFVDSGYKGHKIPDRACEVFYNWSKDRDLQL